MEITKEPFDYTLWQETLYAGMSVEEICAAAIVRRAQMEKAEKTPGVAP